ncbi:hypothetical protein Vretimale_11002, partial [Volvox reticuliferus]
LAIAPEPVGASGSCDNGGGGGDCAVGQRAAGPGPPPERGRIGDPTRDIGRDAAGLRDTGDLQRDGDLDLEMDLAVSIAAIRIPPSGTRSTAADTSNDGLSPSAAIAAAAATSECD